MDPPPTSSLTSLMADAVLLLIEIVSALAEWLFRLVFPVKAKSLAGETAVVTGAGHGIGREVALQVGRLGTRVVCWDIDVGGCEETADEVRRGGGEAWAVTCDVSKREEVARAAKETR